MIKQSKGLGCEPECEEARIWGESVRGVACVVVARAARVPEGSMRDLGAGKGHEAFGLGQLGCG